MPKFETHLIWHDSTGQERNADVTVTYTYHRGYDATLEEPGEPDSVEISDIRDAYGEGVPDHFYTDDELIAECLDDVQEQYEAMLEYRAEQRADDLAREGW